MKTRSEKIRKGVQHIQAEKFKTKIRLCMQYKNVFVLKTTKFINALKYKLIRSFSDNNN